MFNDANSKLVTGQPDLFAFTVSLADSSLIMGHRLSEWTGHGPMLEQDIAISNIALDLIGQARNFYQYAATLCDNTGNEKNITEDDLAYLRDSRQFRNVLLTELPNGDWGQTITKIFFFSAWQFYYYQELMNSADDSIAAIAEKSLKEVTYHLKWSSEWVIRLGDGTDESKKRIQVAVEALWPYTGEMFQPAEFEKTLVTDKINFPMDSIHHKWNTKVEQVFAQATLAMPEVRKWMQTGGKNGIHTEHLGYILAEMQFLQRAYPGCEW
jgi:ring-1,2-phenylacetyl-CoA epoxidase subunit PaaC